MTPFQKRLRLSRAVLIVMLALFVLAQFLPWIAGREVIGTVWGEIGKLARKTMSGKFQMDDLIIAPVIIGMTAVIGAVPWLTGFLSRARPLLWVVRLILAGFGLFLVHFCFRRFGRWDGDIEAGAGFYCVLAAVWVGVLGVGLIPRPVRDGAGDAD